MAQRFTAQEGTVTRELVSVMTKMGANNLKVNKDLFSGKVEIVFERNGKRYVFRSESYNRDLDNYRAAQLCISYLYRALEAYGVTSSEENLFDKVFDNFFLGWEATPDDTVLILGDGNTWYEILGIGPESTKREIISAYKSMAKYAHPDNGGSHEIFIRLRKAYEQGIENGKQ